MLVKYKSSIWEPVQEFNHPPQLLRLGKKFISEPKKLTKVNLISTKALVSDLCIFYKII
jgi:hypothetical protein